MNVVKCSNGHFFDHDSYQVCPHCGAPVAAEIPKQNEEKGKKHRWFVPEKKEPVKKDFIFNNSAGHQNDSSSNEKNIKESSNKNTNFGESGTVDICLSDPQPEGVSELSKESGEQPSEYSPEVSLYSEDPHSNPAPSNVKPEKGNSSQISPTLEEQIKKASASSDGKTMSYFSSIVNNHSNENENNSTVKRSTVDPVVGWLVCVNGEHLGESFEISAGVNSIGRNEDNKIVLSLDMAVSREKHAFITYDPKHRQFYVKPGDSSGLTYLNDEYITETKRLAERDIIEIGNSKLIFVPLCREDFTWEDYLKG